MADESARLTLHRTPDFPVIVGSLEENRALFRARLAELNLSVPVSDVRVSSNGEALFVDWETFPSTQDRAAVVGAANIFVGTSTSEAPIEVNHWNAVLAPTTALALAVDITTPPLADGTYQVIANAMHRMVAEVAAQGSRATILIERSDGASYQQQDHTALAFTQSFNLPITFTVTPGQTIRARVGVQKITGAGGTAEMTGARVTIDKIA